MIARSHALHQHFLFQEYLVVNKEQRGAKSLRAVERRKRKGRKKVFEQSWNVRWEKRGVEARGGTQSGRQVGPRSGAQHQTTRATSRTTSQTGGLQPGLTSQWRNPLLVLPLPLALATPRFPPSFLIITTNSERERNFSSFLDSLALSLSVRVTRMHTVWNSSSSSRAPALVALARQDNGRRFVEAGK